MNKLIISVVLVNLRAACASEKPKEAPPAPTPVVRAAPPVIETPKPVVVAPPVKAEVDPLDDPTSILAKRSVYEPFDVSAVQDADKPVVQAHAKYLSEHVTRSVRIEGNCDERGSTEYNLSLGQRRADGVKKMLEAGGARAEQTSSSSYGEEKPKATGHNEASWSQNRRSDLNYAK